MQEFLNPKSMLTPGAAGGIVMLVANTLSFQFGLEPKWSAIVVSVLLGALVVSKLAAPLLERACYFALNSLIIFCLATGANVVAYSASGGSNSTDRSEAMRNDVLISQHYLSLISMASAASESEIEALCSEAGPEPDEKTKKLCDIIRDQNEQMKMQSTETMEPTYDPNQEKRGFFNPWFQESKYWIVAGSHKDREAAQKQVDQINQETTELNAFVGIKGKTGYYPVIVGHGTYAEAQAIKKKAKKLRSVDDAYLSNF